MGVGDILDGAVKLMRANAKTLLIIIVTVALPLDIVMAYFERNLNGGQGILQIIHNPSASQPNSPSSTFTVYIFTILATWIVIPLVCAAASRVVMASYLGGALKAKDALKAMLRRAPALLVATLIVHLAELVGVLGIGIGYFFVMPLFIMTAPAISLEDLGPFAGVARSFRLAKRRYWPTVGIALLSGLLAYFLNFAVGLVPSVIVIFIGYRWGWLIVAGTSLLQQLVTISLVTIVATLVYLDARIRQEGFDLQVMASRLEAP